MLTLKFHREIYPEASLRTSVEAYAEHGTFELRLEEPYALVDVEATEGDLDDASLGSEFANYALARAVEEKRS